MDAVQIFYKLEKTLFSMLPYQKDVIDIAPPDIYICFLDMILNKKGVKMAKNAQNAIFWPRNDACSERKRYRQERCKDSQIFGLFMKNCVQKTSFCWFLFLKIRKFCFFWTEKTLVRAVCHSHNHESFLGQNTVF